jgi:phospholipid N-methyltransferase
MKGVISGQMKHSIKNSAPWLFVREMFDQSSTVGAIWPSSGYLARSMARSVPLLGDGLVIELGGGTGVVTQALLDHGISPQRLCVVERSAAFARHLRQRFPQLTVVEGCATELSQLLPKGRPVDAIVSSLPLRSMPKRDVAAIRSQWHALLRPGGIVIQFTYDLFGAGRHPSHGYQLRSSRIVWANLPPARVRALQMCPQKNTHR